MAMFTDLHSCKALRMMKKAPKGNVMNWFIRILLATLVGWSHPAQAQDSNLEARANARVQLAIAYYNQKQFSIALQELQNAKNIYDDYAPIYTMYALIYTELDRLEDAEKAYKMVLRLDKDNPEMHNNYGWFLCIKGDYSNGIRWLERAIKNPLYRTPERAYYNAGKCMLKASNEKEAMEWFQKGLDVAPKATAILYEIATIKYQKKQYSDIFPIVDQIHEQEGLNPKTLWLVLRASHRLGQKVEVESYGQQLLSRFPDSAEATKWRSRLLD
jgi:type IV pilus assembly protein PilF